MSDNKCGHCGHENPIGSLVCEKCAIPLSDTPPLKNMDPQPARSVIIPADARDRPATRYAESEPKRQNRGAMFAVGAFGVILVVVLIVLGVSFVKNSVVPGIKTHLAERHTAQLAEDVTDDGLTAEDATAMIEDEVEEPTPEPVIEPEPEPEPEIEEPTPAAGPTGQSARREPPTEDDAVGEVIDEIENTPSNPPCPTGGCPHAQPEPEPVEDPEPSRGAPVTCQIFTVNTIDGAEWMIMSDCSDGISRKCAHRTDNIDPSTGAYQICDVYEPTVVESTPDPVEDPELSRGAPACNSVTLTDPDDSGTIWAVLGDCADNYTRRCAYTEENFNYTTNQFVNCELVAP